MTILGIESSCDECAVAVVRDGRDVLSSVINSQIVHHQPYHGVVPELASRLHVEAIQTVYQSALSQAGLTLAEIDGIAVTKGPGLVGSLLVGLNFAKGLALSSDKPLVGVDHILAHLYSSQLETPLPYPHLGLLVSGGHTLIAVVRGFDEVEVLGTTVDDAVGEAFDKVAKFFGLGYPGGKVIDDLSLEGDSSAYRFPQPRLQKATHPFDVSYSGLKTAVVNQRERFRNSRGKESLADICASFQTTAIDLLLKKVKSVSAHTGIRRLVAGGGVAANRYLRQRVKAWKDWEIVFPPLEYCSDNAAMIAGWGYHALLRGDRAGWDLNAESRVRRFKNSFH